MYIIYKIKYKSIIRTISIFLFDSVNKMLQVLTALITPFDSAENIDYNSLETLIEYQLKEGCGIVLFGTTGECPTLTFKEKNQIMKLIQNKFPDNLNDFVIGVGGYNTKECIENVNEATKFGFGTFMITCPYYNKPTQEGMMAHFTCICEKFLELNFIIYNIPGRTGVNLLPQTLYKISVTNPNIVGIKEASGDLNQMIMVKRLCPNLLLYSGDDSLLIPTLSIGGHGVISVISNLLPKQINDITKLYAKSKQAEVYEAFEEYLKYDELIRLMFVETNPTPIKFVLKARGLIQSDQVRLPLVPIVSQSNRDKIMNVFNKLV